MWTPPDMDQTSSSQPAMQTAVAPAPMQRPDFRSQYNEILAPYQANAQRIFGGDPVFGNSSFAQNHPTASHIMSSLLLAASKSQPGATVGDSIRIAAGMAMAPHEAWQNQQYNLATAPGKMMAPELQLMQHLSQMNYQNSEIQRNKAYSDYLSGARTDQAEATAQAKKSVQHVGNPIPDDDGHLWQPTWDPIAGKAGHIPLEPVNQGYSPSFENYHRGNRAASGPLGNSLEGQLLAGVHPPGPGGYTPDDYADLIQRHEQIGGAMAGSRTSGEQNAPHPQADTAALITQTHSSLYKDIPPIQDRKSYSQSHILAGKNFEDEDKDYQKEVVDKHTKALQDRDDQFNAWRVSDAKQSIPFDRRKDYKAKASSPKPSNSGSNWQPK